MSHEIITSSNALHALVHEFISRQELKELLKTYEARLALKPSPELLNQVAILRCIERLSRIRLQEDMALDVEIWK